nr:MAG TPA: hypothetical protein [Bacteriophage sp.]DAO09922.1 MAG TPA: hypothetical protein [Bacteriophage sp.]
MMQSVSIIIQTIFIATIIHKLKFEQEINT